MQKTNTIDVKIMNVIKLRWHPMLFAVCVAALIFLIHYNFPTSKYGYKCEEPYWEDSSVKHLGRYCNFLSGSHGGEEGTVPIDSSYQLQSVHMIIRHGDRFNMHTLPNYDNRRISCMITPDLKKEFPAMENYHKTMEKMAADGGRTSDQTFHGYNLFPNREYCEFAQLTPIGAAQHVRNGQHLKAAYLEQWKLLEENKIWDQVMVRSTTKSRTFQSAVALLHGFLPELDLGKLQLESALNNTMCTEHSGPSCDCSSVAQGIDLFACNFQQRSPHMMAEPKIRDAYSQIADVLGVASNSLPPPSHIFDISMVHFCHKLPLPSRNGQCIQPWAVRNICDGVNENGEVQTKSDTLQKIVRLKLYPLMYEIVQRMKNQLSGESGLKFVLYSGHDSTVQPFGTAFGYSDGIWSMYATRIALELYTDSKQEGYVRVLLDGKVVTKLMVFCRGNVVDEKLGLCPVQNFIDFIDHGCVESMHENSYEQACKSSFSFR